MDKFFMKTYKQITCTQQDEKNIFSMYFILVDMNEQIIFNVSRLKPLTDDVQNM